jgi:hypothetical protein
MRLPPVCPFHPINKELCSSTGWRSGDVRDTHTSTRRRYGFRGVEPTVAGNEYRINSDQSEVIERNVRVKCESFEGNEHS